MDHRTVYMLIRELSNEEAREYLMTDAEFAILPPDEQLNEVNRAVNATHIDRSLLHMAYSTPPQNEEKANSSNKIMIITAVSMIIGFIIICSAFFFHESNSELAGLIASAGLILVAGIPAICYAVDKYALNWHKSVRETAHRFPNMTQTPTFPLTLHQKKYCGQELWVSQW
ncbi:hypothetical protein [Ruminococcus flavefaciens]|uniref:hypothetical protein n=1 Tax=Ruminococcus flavefaciens TaxID=1265 RepID=UPI0002F3743E|nr:hypothetical protein [Ruminococcus flavefaciens]